MSALSPSSLRRRRLIGGAGIAFALVLVLRLWLAVVGPVPGDRWSLRWKVWPPLPQPWDDLTSFFDLLGTPLIAAATVLCVLVVVRRTDGWRASLFVASACVGVAANAILKLLIAPTPLWAQHHPDDSLNYPSGHTVYAVVLGGALLVLALRRGRRDVASILAGMIVVMGPTRVLGGSHLVSDVIAGYLTGAAWLIGAWLLVGSWIDGPPGDDRPEPLAERAASPSVVGGPAATRPGR